MGKQTYACFHCDVEGLSKDKVTIDISPCGTYDWISCNTCGHQVVKEPRVIDLTQPMEVMQSVKVTEEMIENDEIPY